MNKFLFIFLNSLLSTVAVGLVSCLLGWISSQVNPEHPHQIIPNWMILGVLGMMLGLIVGLVWAIFLVYKEKPLLLPKNVFTASAFSLVFITLLFLAMTFS